MHNVAVFGTIFLLVFIFPLKIYQSVVLKVAQLFLVSNLFPSGLWLKNVSNFFHLGVSREFFEIFEINFFTEHLTAAFEPLMAFYFFRRNAKYQAAYI